MPCPCGSSNAYEACCEPFHAGKALAPTAEALMRSRYAAFVKADIDYLLVTTWPANQKHFDADGYRERAENSIWLGLTIHDMEAGKANDNKGTVTFTAKSMMNGEINDQSEKSLFKKRQGRWYYVRPI